MDQILTNLSLPNLQGADVYVVGAGATAPDRLDSIAIDWMETFWTEFFEQSGATIESYAPTLHDFP